MPWERSWNRERFAPCVKLCRLAAEQGHLAGQYHFARCLEEGIGAEEDLVRGAADYLLSADGVTHAGSMILVDALNKGYHQEGS
jgi:TPR repeat protein